MPVTQAEFEEIINATCSYCRKGSEPRFRPETNEYCHDFAGDFGSYSHCYCNATGVRLVMKGKISG